MTIDFASQNIEAILAGGAPRGMSQVYVEGLPDPIVTDMPPDPKEKANSLVFDGTDDYAATSGNVTDLFTSGDCSIVLWFKAGALDAVFNNCLFYWGDDPLTEGLGVMVDGSTDKLRLGVGAAGIIGPSIERDKWICAAISVGGASGIEAKFLLRTFEADGSYTETRQTTSQGGGSDPGRTDRQAWAISSPIYLGRFPSGACWWPGSIGFVQVFDRAMTYSELGRIMYRVLDAKWGTLWTNLRAQWDLNEGAGTILRNTARTGGAYNLTLGAAGAAPSWDTSDSPFTITYRPYASPATAAAQELEPRATRTSISSISFRVLDTDEWLTALLARSGQAVRQKAATVFLGAEGLLEDEYQIVMSGAVDSVVPLVGRGYEIRIGDAKRFARTALPLGRAKLTAGMTDVASTASVDTIYGFNARTAAAQDVTTIQGRGFFKIDDEIMEYGDVGAGPQFTSVARGRCGTTAAAHAAGAQVEEILIEDTVNPIDMLLYLLMSGTGNEDVDASYDKYARFTTATGLTDTEGRGAGVGPMDIDVDAFETLKARYWSDYLGSFVIDEPIDDILEFCETQILRTLGAYFFVRSDGRLSIGTWHAPSRSGTPTIEAGDHVRPAPSVDFAAIINSLEVSYDYAAGDGRYYGVVVHEDTDSGKKHGRLNPMRIQSKWIRTKIASTLTATFVVTPAEIVEDLKTVLFDRFADPQALFEITTGLWWLTLEIGDGADYQHPDAPDLTAGVRGLCGEPVQVVARVLDPKRARVGLVLMRVPA